MSGKLTELEDLMKVIHEMAADAKEGLILATMAEQVPELVATENSYSLEFQQKYFKKLQPFLNSQVKEIKNLAVDILIKMFVQD
jgi:isopentenyl diphosphate isomerase/L-lactate dehydrogenase-like FMN-dependent dehydrogenase